jgi:hypothetical protein
VDTKALASPLAMTTARKSAGGVMDGVCPHGVEERSSHRGIPGGGRHPGFRESVALRGVTSERGPWSIPEDGGSIQPSARRNDDAQGCASQLETRRGPPSTSSCGSRRRPARSFARSYSARAIQLCRPTAAAANGGRVGASPASVAAIGRWSSESALLASLHRRGAFGFEGIDTARSIFTTFPRRGELAEPLKAR